MLKIILILVFVAFELFAAVISGRVVDVDSGKVLSGVKVTSDLETYTTKKNGRFKIHGVTNRVLFRALGYKRATVQVSSKRDIRLKAVRTKALYVSANAINNKKKLRKILNIAARTQVNTLVVDVKNANGRLTFKGNNALAKKIGAYKYSSKVDPKKFVKFLKSHGVYLIARLPVFKDNLLAKKRPNLAIRRNGAVFRDRDKLRWVNPYKGFVHQYNISIAREIAKYGFDEIQFDYIRFPVKSKLRYGRKSNAKTRVKALQTFLRKAKYALTPYNVFTSIDTFGVSCWTTTDSGIGHNVKKLEKYVDYLSPMLYPSGFGSGVPGLRNPLKNNEKVIYDSLRSSIKKHKVKPEQFKPWLQAFNDYAFDRRRFGKREVDQQIKACDRIGTAGWLLWNASCNYDKYFSYKKHSITKKKRVVKKRKYKKKKRYKKKVAKKRKYKKKRVVKKRVTKKRKKSYKKKYKKKAKNSVWL